MGVEKRGYKALRKIRELLDKYSDKTLSEQIKKYLEYVEDYMYSASKGYNDISDGEYSLSENTSEDEE